LVTFLWRRAIDELTSPLLWPAAASTAAARLKEKKLTLAEAIVATKRFNSIGGFGFHEWPLEQLEVFVFGLYGQHREPRQGPPEREEWASTRGHP
jgi:hypothetical protein